ncbi:MAG: hypothetical protein U1F57_09580 [bacterium]
MNPINAQENVMYVERKATPNAFFASLAEYQVRPKQETPLQKFRNHLKTLEKMADAGDIKGWQENLPTVHVLALEADVDSAKDLNLRVQLKKWELTLMLQAGNKALQQAKELEKKANEAQIVEDEDMAHTLIEKAQRLVRLGNQLHEQLLEKTA